MTTRERALSMLSQVQTFLDVPTLDDERRGCLLAVFEGSLAGHAAEQTTVLDAVLSDMTQDSTAYLRGLADGRKERQEFDRLEFEQQPDGTSKNVVLQAARIAVRCGLLEVESDGAIYTDIRLDGRTVPCHRLDLGFAVGEVKVVMDVALALMRTGR